MSLAGNASPIAENTKFYNKYNFLRLVGRGSFGEVWLARDQAVGHDYAIKILHSGITIDQRLREAQVGHAFTHNNLVKVHQADVSTDGQVVIAMDYMPDGPITTLTNPSNFLPLPIALKLTVDVLRGLEHLHARSLYHNDIKPQNILRGPHGQAKLSDYGIVGVSKNGAPVPPPDWYVFHAAPEVVKGHGIEARTDIFQTGATLFRLLVGLGTLEAKFLSFGQSAYETAAASGTLISAKDFPPFIPQAVSKAIMTSTHHDPTKRYQSALEMRRALEKLSFPGFWSVDENGALYGEDVNHIYHFEYTKTDKQNSSVDSFKKFKKSGREIRVSRFSSKGIPDIKAQMMIANFQKAVVNGTLSV